VEPKLIFRVRPALPAALEPLTRLCHNLWFAWNSEAAELFQRIDRELWEATGRNPAALLNRVRQARLEALARDDGFLAQLERVVGQLDAYLASQACPFLGQRAPGGFQVAYFSAEYGLADCLPIYSGGLGILSGDHLKSASDLNLPLVAVGLAYGQGYFSQYLNPDGWQQEQYNPNDFYDMPTRLVRDAEGNPLTIKVDIAGRELLARAWLVLVGRVELYLLDANLEQNPPELRSITSQLYGGDHTMRIRQEILLGIGGVRLLAALGLEPQVFHMNEGHSAFAALERIRRLIAEHGLSFDQARQVVAATNCFTTHTPVPAGNDYFSPELMTEHFSDYVTSLGISLPVLLGFGRLHPTDQGEPFCMTVLALRMSSFANGVSRLHGRVSRRMWRDVWPHFPVQDLPLGHITNGVHIASWVSNDMAYLFDRYLGPAWKEDPDAQAVWRGIEQVPDSELWRVRERRRTEAVGYVRRRVARQLARRGAGSAESAGASDLLDPEALTIVFARRFATYKRATLLLRDLDRLARLVGDPQRPVQIIFAGKAHPQDEEGKEYIRRIFDVTRDRRFAGRIVFVEDYDLDLARHLVQGADVWLNTPRRPLEACGTSGMKAVANGGLHLSILDGWWAEGFRPDIGWAIGQGEQYEDQELQDRMEADAIYRLLENEVVPLFYQRNGGGLPPAWIGYIKRSMRALCPTFSAHRMVEDYMDEAYLPAGNRYQALAADDFQVARQLAAWQRRIMEHWSEVKVLQVTSSAEDPLTWGQSITVRAEVHLGQLTPQEVACDIYHGRIDAHGAIAERRTAAMRATGNDQGVYHYQGEVTCGTTGRWGLQIRVTPYHPHLASQHALGLAVWG